MSNEPRIVFRADGNSRIGLGHVVRSLALAQMLRQDFRCTFVIQHPEQALLSQLREVCEEVLVLPEREVTEQEASDFAAQALRPTDVVVLDGYSFGTAYQQRIKEKGCALVCIDDTHAYPFVADAVINHTSGVAPSSYEVRPYTRLLLGSAYALLRPPFLRPQPVSRDGDALHTLFLNMGGADPENHTCKVLSQLQARPFIVKINLVTGLGYCHMPALRELIKGDKRIRHYHGISGQAIAAVMKESGTAVCPPSSISFEYASIGGLLFQHLFADNQKHVQSYFVSQGLAYEFSDSFERVFTSGKLSQLYTKMLERQRQEFDGNSGQRLLQVFRELACAT